MLQQRRQHSLPRRQKASMTKQCALTTALDSRPDSPGAVADYTKAIKLNPNNAEAYYNRGVARLIQGDKTGAIIDCTEAIKLDPTYAKAYHRRGDARAAQSDKTGAIKDYQKAADLYKRQGKLSLYQDMFTILSRK